MYTLHEYQLQGYILWRVLKIFSRWWNDFYVSWKVKVKLKWIEGGLILLWLFGEMKSLIILWKYFRGSDKLLESTSQRYYSASRCKQRVYILFEYHSQSNILWMVLTALCQCNTTVYTFLTSAKYLCVWLLLYTRWWYTLIVLWISSQRYYLWMDVYIDMSLCTQHIHNVSDISLCVCCVYAVYTK